MNFFFQFDIRRWLIVEARIGCRLAFV